MQPVTNLYKEFVYSTTMARHFLPEAIVRVIDIFAKQNAAYTVSSMMPFSSRAQLLDDVFSYAPRYGTCEYRQNLLDGKTQYISESNTTEGSVTGQIGVLSTAMSYSDGTLAEPFVLTCTYSETVSTVGRTIFFNDAEQGYPVDFTLVYYLDATVLKTVQVTGHTGFMYSDLDGVTNYNKIIITFTKMSQKDARVKIIEDVAGVYLQYLDDGVISISYAVTVDIFSKELLTSEADLVVKNTDKLLDALNTVGIEAYLRNRQPIDLNLYMVYPAGNTERIQLGTLYLTGWDTDSKSLSASFTARDALEIAFQDEYYKGMYYETPTSYYDILSDVLQDSGIFDYVIDETLRNIYTYGIVPIANHKEIMRLIAQATQSVVLPTLNGGVKIKYIGVPTEWYTSVDMLDYAILYDPPIIKSKTLAKSVTSKIYTYTPAATTSEVYKETRTIAGTETFVVKYTKPAKGCVASVSVGTLVSAEYYTNAAVLTVTFTGDVVVTITGYAIEKTTADHIINNTIDTNLAVDAEKVEIDNELITTAGVAANVATYAAYWRARSKEYTFDWRENPALELLDPITVHDDFSNDNTTVLVEQRLDYTSGTLEGSSKTIY